MDICSLEFDLVMQSILEHVSSRLAFFRTTSGLVYTFEYCEINGILTVIRDQSLIVYRFSGGGGGRGFGGGVQFLKRVNFGGSVLNMYKV